MAKASSKTYSPSEVLTEGFHDLLLQVDSKGLDFLRGKREELAKELKPEDLPLTLNLGEGRDRWVLVEVDPELLLVREGIPPEKVDRIRKLAKILQKGWDPYGERYQRTLTLGELRRIAEELEPGTKADSIHRVAGRIIAKRVHGKLAFMDIMDHTGKAQLFISKRDVENYKDMVKLLDVGDWIGVEGYPMKTQRGEPSLAVRTWKILSKCLNPIPEKWHGLKDTKLRYRQRYLDLIVNPETRAKFFLRSKMISLIRKFLEERGFHEVETPILSPMATGALARPFITHHNALDMDLYLRIAPELYLKRLIVGGMDRVFEIGKVFRNEGISTKHNPEFTILELYQAFGDLTDMMRIAEEMIVYLADNLVASRKIKWKDGEIDLNPPFQRISYEEALKRYGDISLKRIREDEGYRKELSRKLEVPWDGNLPHFIDKVFEAVVEPHLINPTFILDFPVELSPLAKRKRGEEETVERFELFIANFEVANAFTELNDPDDQAKRFLEQLKLKELGDEEAHQFDRDYIEALEYGLPPTGGMGFGIDRLAMIFTNSQSIREVILFPLLRPEE